MVLRYTLIERPNWLQMILENTQITEEEAPRLKAHLLSLAKLSIPYLILDLSKVKWIDSAGLAALLSAHNAFQKNGLYLTNIAHEPVKTLIAIARLDEVLIIREEVVDAMKEIEAILSGSSR